MSRRSKAAGWGMAAVLAAAALLLSLALPMLVPDYRNAIREVDYDGGVIASAAADEEIELYPWTEFREEDCRTLAELAGNDPAIREQARLDVFYLLESLLMGGFLKDYELDVIEPELEQGVLYDESQGRLYARGLTVETGDGEAELSFAFSGQGMEYVKITLPWEKEVTPEESGEIQRQLRERLAAFQRDYYGLTEAGEYETSADRTGNAAADGYTGAGGYETLADGTGNASADGPAAETDTAPVTTDGGEEMAVPENVFEEFYQGIYALEDGMLAETMGWGFSWMVEVAFQEFACDIIPYQGEFLLVFSDENADASMILIYSPAAERISGFSLQF